MCSPKSVCSLLLIALLIVGVASQTALAAPATVVLNVIAYGTVDESNMRRARDTVSTLMASAGILVKWRDCNRQDCSQRVTQGLDVLLLPETSGLQQHGGEVVRNAALQSRQVLVYVPALQAWVGTMQRSARARADVRLSTLEIG